MPTRRPYSTDLSDEDALGASYPTTSSCPGKPPTTTLGNGVWMEHGRPSTPLYGKGCACSWVESLPPARRSSTPRRPRPPRKEAHEATTEARRSAVESGICSLTRKVW